MPDPYRIQRAIEEAKRTGVLNLDNNQLTSLPAEIGELTSLTTLYLHNNQLTSLPAEIVKLTSLTSDELKELRRQRALRWLNRPTFSLQSVMLVVTWAAVCSALLNVSLVFGLAALAISSLWLVIAPIAGRDRGAD